MLCGWTLTSDMTAVSVGQESAAVFPNIESHASERGQSKLVKATLNTFTFRDECPPIN